MRQLADAASDLVESPAASFALPVTQLWATRELLEAPRDDLDWVTVAVVVDLPVAEVPWLTKPKGAEHWENATGAAKKPVVTLWRSAHAPVWNHYLERPALLWERETGLAEDVMRALNEGHGEVIRTQAPSADELRARLHDDIAVSLDALRERTQAYEKRRWAPGKLTPASDALWEASNGYIDLLAGLTTLGTGTSPR